MEMKDLFEAMTSLLLGKATLITVGQEIWYLQSWCEYGEERNDYSSVTLTIASHFALLRMLLLTKTSYKSG
jgi:hypothetical protein